MLYHTPLVLHINYHLKLCLLYPTVVLVRYLQPSRGVYRVLVERPEGKSPFGRPRRKGIILRWIIRKWKRNIYYISWGCVWSLWHAACNAHASYFHLWPVRLYNIFPYYVIKGTIFGKKIKVTERKMSVSIFYKTFFWNISHSKRNKPRYDRKSINVFIWSTSYSCHILLLFKFSGHIFEK